MNPALVPAHIKLKLSMMVLSDVKPLNLFRLPWHSQPLSQGSGFARVNLFEFRAALWRWIYAY